MNRVVWGAGAVIVALGMGAILLLPHDLPKVDPYATRGALRSPGAEKPGPTGMGTGVPGAAPGAGMQAAIPAILVVEQVSPIVGPDGRLGESLGIETAGGAFTAVLPRGTQAPVLRFVTCRTRAANTRARRLHVLGGVTDRVAQNHDLGWVRVIGLPPGVRGTIQVTVGFRIADGAVVLAAADPASGHGYAIQTSEPPPGFPR